MYKYIFSIAVICLSSISCSLNNKPKSSNNVTLTLENAPDIVAEILTGDVPNGYTDIFEDEYRVAYVYIVVKNNGIPLPISNDFIKVNVYMNCMINIPDGMEVWFRYNDMVNNEYTFPAICFYGESDMLGREPSVKVTVDIDNSIKEANENNNTINGIYQIAPNGVDISTSG